MGLGAAKKVEKNRSLSLRQFLFRFQNQFLSHHFASQFRFKSKETPFLHQNKKIANFAEHFSFSLESDRRINFGMLTDRLMTKEKRQAREVDEKVN